MPERPRLTSFSSPKDKETRSSAPAGSFVSHEISTLPCPKGMGFGFALTFPVISPVGIVLLTSRKPESTHRCQRNIWLLNCLGLLAVFAMVGAEQKLQLFVPGVG
jgi:hypothetical protein